MSSVPSALKSPYLKDSVLIELSGSSNSEWIGGIILTEFSLRWIWSLNKLSLFVNDLLPAISWYLASSANAFRCCALCSINFHLQCHKLASLACQCAMFHGADVNVKFKVNMDKVILKVHNCRGRTCWQEAASEQHHLQSLALIRTQTSGHYYIRLDEKMGIFEMMGCCQPRHQSKTSSFRNWLASRL